MVRKRFALRTLLIASSVVMLLACLELVNIGNNTREIRAERKIWELGGETAGFREPYFYSHIEYSWWEYLVEANHTVAVVFPEGLKTDDSLTQLENALSHMKHLEYLEINGTPLSADAISKLEKYCSKKMVVNSDVNLEAIRKPATQHN